VVFVYQDEFTTHRRPAVAHAWHDQGGPGRPAELGHKLNTERRLIGALDATPAWGPRHPQPSPVAYRVAQDPAGIEPDQRQLGSPPDDN
jgi:hypothetical protein